MALRVIVILLCLALIPSTAIAQESVKRAIFEDCDQARLEFSKLSIEQQSSLLDFFARVIALNTESPSAPEVYAVAPGSQLPSDSKTLTAPRGADLIPGALWQSMDAKRELRAKKCSLELLDLAGPLALEILPSLVTTYSEQALSDEVAVNLEEVAASIAEAAHLQGRTPETQQIESIVPHTFGQRTLVARNFIHEFKQEALPYLISLIATRKEQLPPDMQRYLRSLDSDGALAFRAVINLLPGLTADQAQHLISVLPEPTPQVWPTFIKDLAQISAYPDRTKLFAPLLARACIAMGGITADQSLQELIAGIPDILDSGTITPEGVKCLVQSSPPLARKAVTQLCDLKIEVPHHFVQICSLGIEKGSPEIRGEAYTCLRRFALNPNSTVWRESLLALAAFPERRADTITVAQQLLKTTTKPLDSTKPQDIKQAVIELLQTIPLGKEYGRFEGFILESLRSHATQSAALDLAKQAPALNPTILALALTTPPTSESISALNVVAARRDISHKSLPQLIELLKYPEAALEAERALVSIGKNAANTLRKALSRLPTGVSRLSATGLLVSSRSATKIEAYSLSKSLAELADCSFIGDRSQILCALSSYAADDAEISEHIMRSVQRCLPAFKKDALANLVACKQDLILKASDTVGSMCRMVGEGVSNLEPLVELANQEIRTDSRVGGPLVAQMLLNCPATTQRRILAALTHHSVISPEVADAIRAISTKQPPDTKPTPELLRALAYTEDTHYPWRDYVKQAIESASQGNMSRSTAEVIAVIPVDAVLAEILPALESDNAERLIGAALVGGALGSKAIPIVSRLWHLRTMRAPGVRYTSALALLQINPLTPDLHDSVRRTLVNRFFETALTMPIRWSNTVALNDLSSGTFGVLRREHLQQLLTTK